MKLANITLISIATTAMMGSAAFAGADATMSKTTKMTKRADGAVMTRTIDADGQIGTITVADRSETTAVLGAFAAQDGDVYIVQDETGDLYINRIVDISDLPDPSYDPNVIDEYTTTYRGMTFTNRVVANDPTAAARN